MKFKSRFSKNPRVSLSEFEPTRAKQSFRDECDVNQILKKYQATGIPPSVNKAQGHYGDFAHVDDYQTALNTVLHANESFMDLPSSVRARFGHDPAQLLAFVQDSSNLDEAIRLGIVQSPHHEAPIASEAPSKTPRSSKTEVSSNASDET